MAVNIENNIVFVEVENTHRSGHIFSQPSTKHTQKKMDDEQGFDRIYGFLDFLCPLYAAAQDSVDSRYDELSKHVPLFPRSKIGPHFSLCFWSSRARWIIKGPEILISGVKRGPESRVNAADGIRIKIDLEVRHVATMVRVSCCVWLQNSRTSVPTELLIIYPLFVVFKES